MVIPFYINPLQPWVSSERAEAAILAATRAWMRANPRIRFHYLGTASNPPFTGDSYNFIGWAATTTEYAARTDVQLDDSGRWPEETDISLNPMYAWKWSPCAQRSGSCTMLRDKGPIQPLDIQTAVTHELGHALGLKGLRDAASRHLTMYDGEPIAPGERKQQTLGLGDILGIRSAYACGRRCPRIAVYSP